MIGKSKNYFESKSRPSPQTKVQPVKSPSPDKKASNIITSTRTPELTHLHSANKNRHRLPSTPPTYLQEHRQLPFTLQVTPKQHNRQISLALSNVKQQTNTHDKEEINPNNSHQQHHEHTQYQQEHPLHIHHHVSLNRQHNYQGHQEFNHHSHSHQNNYYSLNRQSSYPAHQNQRNSSPGSVYGGRRLQIEIQPVSVDFGAGETGSELDYVRLLREKEETIKQLRQILQMIEREGGGEQAERHSVLQARIKQYTKQIKVLQIQNLCLINVIQNHHHLIKDHPLSHQQQIANQQHQLQHLQHISQENYLNKMQVINQENYNNKLQAISQQHLQQQNLLQKQLVGLQDRNRALIERNQQLQGEYQKLVQVMREREGLEKRNSSQELQNRSNEKDKDKLSLSKIRDQYNQNLKLAKENFENDQNDLYESYLSTLKQVEGRIQPAFARIHYLEQLCQSLKGKIASRPQKIQEIETLMQKDNHHKKELDQLRHNNTLLLGQLRQAKLTIEQLQNTRAQVNQQATQQMYAKKQNDLQRKCEQLTLIVARLQEDKRRIQDNKTRIQEDKRRIELALEDQTGLLKKIASLQQDLQKISRQKQRVVSQWQDKMQTIVQTYQQRLKEGGQSRQIAEKIQQVVQTYQKEIQIYKNLASQHAHTSTSHKQNLDQTQQQLQSTIKQLQQKQLQLQHAQRQVRNSQQQLQHMQRQLNNAPQPINNSQEIQKIRQQLNQNEQKLNEKQQQLQRKDQQIKNTKQQLQYSLDQLKLCQNQLINARNQLNQSQSVWSAQQIQINSHKKQNQQLNQHIQDLIQNQQQHLTIIKQLQLEKRDLLTQKNSLTGQVVFLSKFQLEASELRKNLQNSSKNLQQAQIRGRQTEGELLAHINRHKEETIVYQSKIAAQQENLDDVKHRLITLTKQHQELIAQVQAGSHGQMEELLQRLKERIKIMQEQYGQRMTVEELEHFQRGEKALEEKYCQNKQLIENIEALRRQLHLKKLEAAQNQQKIATLQRQIVIYQQQLAQQQILYENLLQAKIKVEKQSLTQTESQHKRQIVTVETKIKQGFVTLQTEIDQFILAHQTRRTVIQSRAQQGRQTINPDHQEYAM